MSKSKLINILFIINLLTFGNNVIAQTAQEENMALIGSFAENVFAKKDLSNIEQYMHKDYIQQSNLSFRLNQNDSFQLPVFKFKEITLLSANVSRVCCAIINSSFVGIT